MTKKKQIELLTCTINQMYHTDLYCLLKHTIANSDKQTRCIIEQWLMDNARKEYTIAFEEMNEE